MSYEGREIITITKAELKDLVTEIIETTLLKDREFRLNLDDLPPICKQSTVAKYLDVDRKTVNNWIKKGLIDIVFIDGRPMVPRSEILKLLNK